MTNEEHELYGFQIERAHYWREAYLSKISFDEHKRPIMRCAISGWLYYQLLSQKKRHMNKCLVAAYQLERRYLAEQYPGFTEYKSSNN